MSAQIAHSEPRRIKATHRRRRKIASGRFVQRYYDPQVGRFLSVDPVASRETSDNFNRYVYANGNPYKFTDPDGRESGAYYTNPELHMAAPQLSPEESGVALLAMAAPFAIVAPEAFGMLRTVVSLFRSSSSEAGSGSGKTYTTYTRSKTDGTVYSGRTSGKGTPEQQVAARTSKPDHQAKTQEGYGPAAVDKNSPNGAAIRGREQQLIEQNGGAQSQGGASGNKINGVSPTNPKAETYRAACKTEFGC